MRSVLVAEPGAPLRLVQSPSPVPAPGQILVKVQAAGINFADLMVRQGFYAAAKGLYPLAPGFEFAGVVQSAPAGSGLAVGAEVLGITRFGGYAEEICVEPWQLFPRPAGWSAEDCAGLPAVFLTAWHGLFRTAKVEAGETLLVHSAAGGAGGAFVQLGKIAGCRVVAVVGSGDKVQTARGLGADAVVDRSAGPLWEEADRLAPEGFDAIFDSGGVATVRPGFARLKPGGRLVVYGFAEILPRGRGLGLLSLAVNRLRVPSFSPFEMTGTNRTVSGFNVVYLFHERERARRAMEEILGWIAQGRIKKPPLRAFPAERAAEAHALLASGKTVGKLVLTF